MTAATPPTSECDTAIAAAPQAEVTLDLARLESRLPAFFAMEPMLRMVLSVMWLLYWLKMPMLIAVVPFGLWHLAQQPEVIWSLGASAPKSEAWAMAIVGRGGVAAIAFSYASMWALLGLSRAAAMMAVVLGIYMLGALPDWQVVLILQMLPPAPELVVHFALAALAGVWIMWGLLRAHWEVVRLTPGERLLLRPFAPVRLFPRSQLRELTWIPKSINLIPQRHTRAAVAVALVAGGFCYLIVLNQLQRAPSDFLHSLSQAISACKLTADIERGMACVTDRMRTDRVWLALRYVGIISGCLLAAHQVLSWGQRRLVFSLNHVTVSDTRPPVLFLRSFRDEHIQLRHPRTTWLGWLSQLGRPRVQLEHLVLERFAPLGPVITVGNPQDEHAPYGAAREYLSHEAWHAKVESLWQQGQRVVVAIDQTAGVLWEVQQLVAAGLAAKCLFVLHPRFEDPAANAAVLQHLRQLPGMRHIVPGAGSGGVEQHAVLGWFVDESGTVHVARGNSFRASSYTILLGWFERTRSIAKTLDIESVVIESTANPSPPIGHHTISGSAY